jgi:hypothetical protein
MTLRTAACLFAWVLTALLPSYSADAETLQGKGGMVASRSDLASEVGKEILQSGGNAVDAAVATAFALAVVYPSAGNLGGGGFMLIALQDGTVVAQDNREKAPSAAHRDMFLDANGNVDRNLAVNSLQSSGVPGTVAGVLDALERYGTMTRQQVIAPALKLAREGFELNDDLAGQFAEKLCGEADYVTVRSMIQTSGVPRPTTPVARKLASDRQFFWLRQDSHTPLLDAVLATNSKKLFHPAGLQPSDPQLKLFAKA